MKTPTMYASNQLHLFEQTLQEIVSDYTHAHIDIKEKIITCKPQDYTIIASNILKRAPDIHTNGTRLFAKLDEELEFQTGQITYRLCQDK